MKSHLLQNTKFRMEYVRQKAKLMAKMKMSGGNKTPRKAQVMEEEILADGHAALSSAGDQDDPEADKEDREERPRERQDRVDQGPQEEKQDDVECGGRNCLSHRQAPAQPEDYRTQGMWTS